MIRIRGLLFLGLFLVYSLQSQTYFGPETFIANGTADGGWVVLAADIDLDGDLDVLSSSGNDNKIAWYENLDGAGNFSDQIIISSTSTYVNHIHATDIDGDGDLDVVSGNTFFNEIAWYENTDGNGSFGEKKFISISLLCPTCITSGDLDQDGDMDLIVASRDDGRISWFINTDGLGNFSIPNVIAESIEGAFWVDVTDMENDGDLDIISCAYWGDKIVWHENIDGSATFEDAKTITELVDDPQAAISADLDNDGDVDILSVSQNDSKVALYMNLDGQGTFGPQILISDDVWGADCIFAADLDNDGDLDAVVGSMHDDDVVWFENTDGNGNFGEKNTIAENTDFVTSVHAADLDGDGDLDVLSANHNDDNISWYENISLIIFTNPQSQEICPGYYTSFSFSSNDALSYQWQVNQGIGFINISNNNIYSGVDSTELYIASANVSMSGFEYRCLLVNQHDTLYTDIVVLTVEDIEPPLILSEHDDINLNVSANCEAILPDFLNDLIVMDYCDSLPATSQYPLPGTLISGLENNITLTVSDYMENSSSVSFNVAVVDNFAPVISSVHEDQFLEADSDCVAILPDYTLDLIATDDCYFEIVQVPNAGSVVYGFFNQVTLTAIDDSENSSSVHFNVEVRDNTAPDLACTGDLTIELDEGVSSFVVPGNGLNPLVAGDNCGIVSLENDYNYLETLEGATFPIGITNLVWEVEDAASNKTVCNVEVTIIPHQGIHIYPNPTHGPVFINFYRTDVIMIKVFDSNGRFLFEKPVSTQTEKMNLSYFDSGLYSILIFTAQEVYVYKFVKVR